MRGRILVSEDIWSISTFAILTGRLCGRRDRQVLRAPQFEGPQRLERDRLRAGMRRPASVSAEGEADDSDPFGVQRIAHAVGLLATLRRRGAACRTKAGSARRTRRTAGPGCRRRCRWPPPRPSGAPPSRRGRTALRDLEVAHRRWDSLFSRCRTLNLIGAVFAVQQSERDVGRLDGGVDRHGDRDETKRDVSAPDGSHSRKSRPISRSEAACRGGRRRTGRARRSRDWRTSLQNFFALGSTSPEQ
jgi:hypothetical protein